MRVRYVDEMSKEGELDLGKVRAGDLVRFVADFRKVAGPKGVLNIRAGEVGEVVTVGPEWMTVRAPGERTAAGDTFGEHVEAALDARDLKLVAVLVDSRDPRIGDGRITKVEAKMKTTAALETWELEQYVMAAVKRGANPLSRGMVAVELARHGPANLRVANLIARTTPDAWQMFVVASGIAVPQRRVAAAPNEPYELAVFDLADWAVDAARSTPEFSETGPKTLHLESRLDVLQALDALIEDVEGGPYKTHHEMKPSGEDFEFERTMQHDPEGMSEELLDELATQGAKLRRARDYVAGLSDAEWLEAVQRSRGFIEGLKTPLPKLTTPKQPPKLQPPKLEVAPEPEPELEPEPEPEGEKEKPAAQVPIRWQPSGGTARWVWAEEGQRVYLKSRKEYARVLGLDPPDGVLVELEGSDERVALDASDVWLNQKPSAEPKPEPVPPEYMSQWKSDRKRHGSCYGVSHGEGDPPNGDRETNHTGRAGEARSPGHTRERAGDRSGVRRETRAVTAARDLWDGVVLYLEYTGAGEGDGARRADWQRSALAPLGIGELKRWLSMPDEFAVVSAYSPQAKSENKEAHGQLMAELQRRGYSPKQIRPLRGQYFGPEKDPTGKPVLDEDGKPKTKMVAEQSVLVLGMGFEEALEIGRELKQESVIYKGKDGVVGAYYTDGSGRVNLALRGDEPAVGEEAAEVRERKKKPEKRGPPSPEDPWSKARSVGFEFPINWDKTFQYKDRPLSIEDARAQTESMRARNAAAPGPNLFWEHEEDHTGADEPAAQRTITFREANPDEFERGIQQVEQSTLDQDRDYTAGSQLFMSTDGKAGYAISPDGEMKWVWSTMRGYGKAAVADAIRNGAHHLSAFDNGKLVGFYKGTGFDEYKREKNWTEGEPDVVFMRLPGSSAGGTDGRGQENQTGTEPVPPGPAGRGAPSARAGRAVVRNGHPGHGRRAAQAEAGGFDREAPEAELKRSRRRPLEEATRLQHEGESWG